MPRPPSQQVCSQCQLLCDLEPGPHPLWASCMFTLVKPDKGWSLSTAQAHQSWSRLILPQTPPSLPCSYMYLWGSHNSHNSILHKLEPIVLSWPSPHPQQPPPI